MLVTPSQMRVSSVPNCGAGRRSQRISSNASMTPVCSMSATYPSSSSHVANWNGSPAVGSCWNMSARFDAYPVSLPPQNGELAESDCRCANVVSIARWTGSTLARSSTPTCTCTP